MRDNPLGIITPKTFSGEQIAKIAVSTFGTDEITPEQLSATLAFLVPSLYELKYHRIGNGGKKPTFIVPKYGGGNPAKAVAHRPFQIQPMNDIYPNLVVKKARQLGFSELGVAFMIWWADVHSQAGVNCLYTFPTLKQMRDFVQMRLNSVLNSSPYYRSIIGDTNSVNVKQIRNSFLTFRTSSKSSSVEGINADFASVDEYDHVSASAEQSIEGSISSSPYKVLRRWSTPTAKGMGIDDLYEHSDQWFWSIKCNHCGYENELSYDAYDGSSIEAGGNILQVDEDGVDYKARTVRPGTFIYVCKKCGKKLDRWYSGHYLCRYPSRTADTSGIRGYTVNQMDAVWITADMLKASELKAKSKQSFYNYCLGEPYEDQNLKVYDSDILDHAAFPTKVENRADYKFILVGIDWGIKHTVVIAGITENNRFDIINDFQVQGVRPTVGQAGEDIRHLYKMLKPYNPDLIFADVGDSGEKIHHLIDIYGQNKVWGVKYPSNPTSGLYSATGQLQPSWNEKTHVVSADKLVQHKRFIDLMKRGKVHFWAHRDEALNRYITHWQNVLIRNEETANGDTREVIEKRKGKGDHSASCSVYVLLAYDYLREKIYGNTDDEFTYSMLSANLTPEKTDILKEHNLDSVKGTSDTAINPYA